MAAHLNKIAANSPSRQHPSELEASIANAIYDLETNTADMKGALRALQFVSAKEVRLYHFSVSLSLPSRNSATQSIVSQQKKKTNNWDYFILQ